jgi:hypothetical protein
MIVATTAISNLLENLQITTIFSVVLNVPQLQELQDAIVTSITKPIGLKQMLMVIEMALSGDEHTVDTFIECMYLVCR